MPLNPATTSSVNRLDRLLPWLLAIVLLGIYLALRQANLTYDEAAFLAWYHDPSGNLMHRLHPAWGYLLCGWLQLTQAAGLTLVAGGKLQAALATALSLVLFYRLLRRQRISPAIAACFMLLMGLNATFLEFATTVELYGVLMVATMLGLLAFDSELKRPGPAGAAGLWLACLAMVAIHPGWAFLVLAIYLALAWGERGRPRRAAGRIAEGAAVALIVGGWIVLAGGLGAEHRQEAHAFISGYYGPKGEWGLLGSPLWQPYLTLIHNSGLLLYPAIWTAVRERRRLNGWFIALLVATATYFIVFGGWPADMGEFFTPLQPLWAFFAARGIDRWSGLLPRRGRLLAAGLAGYAVLVAAPFFNWPLAPFVIAFWAYVALSVIAARWSEWRPSPPPAPVAQQLGLALAMVALTLAFYMPRALAMREPDDVRLRLDAFMRIAEPEARLVTIQPGNRPFARTMRETIAPLQHEPDTPARRQDLKLLARWLHEARAGGPPVYIDPYVWLRHDELDLPVNWEALEAGQSWSGDEFYYRVPRAQ